MIKLKTYKITSDHDGNEAFEVEARSLEDAYKQALNELGWNVLIKQD